MAIVYEGFGNVLTHKAQTIVCPVNVVGVMGAGLARAFRNRFHGLNTSYKRKCETGDIAIGCVDVVPISGSQQQVLLFPTKGHWKDDSKLFYIEEGLQDLVKRHESLGIKDIAFPPIGCGLGNLDYVKEVRPLLHKYLEEADGIRAYILLREND